MRILVIGPIGTAPVVLSGQTAVIMRDDGTPFMAAGHVANGLVAFAHANDPEFETVLSQLGYDRTIVVEHVGGK